MNQELSTELLKLLDGCLKTHRQSQKMLYQHFYAYALSICLRYTSSRSEAVEVLNDGFLKIFTKISLYNPEKSLKGWIRRIMINTSIDHYRKQNRHWAELDDIENGLEVSVQETTLSKLTYDEIIAEVQELTPAYRAVFNLYVIDGFNHEEIAKQLEISVGTSKSNLSRARAILQRRLVKIFTHEQAPK